uniref:DUF1330 domain-containing protein n=1 Tax=Roseihalotalea indica TaxID=2867963 RepID=A0AA49GL33_9BACT|nr:DUF1330 domain-containing protein [Tunicatimonas sp. TK19036]
MIYITQLIYIREGQEATFHEFENVAIPIIANYRGELLLRLRPDASSVVEASSEVPYEVHLVSFPAEKDFEQFMQDEERKNYLHLKEQSIRAVTLIKGHQLG